MELKLKDIKIHTLYENLKRIVKGEYEQKGFEHYLKLDNKFGKGYIVGYDFGNGFNLVHLKINLYTLLELYFEENGDNVLRYIFSLNGEIIHTLTNAIRYRLTANTASIVSVKNQNNQTFAFPAQNDINTFFLQVNTSRFAIDLRKELINLPEELSNVLLNKPMNDHFIHHSNYALDIGETLHEIISEKNEGLLKRFYIESKALELLWLHTERFKYEKEKGFNKSLLRQADLELIRKARKYIRDHFHEEVRLTQLARTIGTNETKLKVGFRRLYGKSFSEILRDDRLLKAKHLIEENKHSIKEISNKCGYNSVSMFGRRFKEKYGISPGKLNLT